MRRTSGFIALFVCLAGCRDAPPSPQAQAGVFGTPAGMALPPADSAAGVAARIHDLRMARRYSELDRMIVPERRGRTVAMLMAVDQILDADRSVKQRAESRFGDGAARPWSLSRMADNLGLLSDSIRIVSVNEQDDRAEVVLQEGDMLPLVYEQFERRDQQWRWAPQPVKREFADDLMRLGRMVQQMAAQLTEPDMTIDKMNDGFRFRVGPLLYEIDRRYGNRHDVGT